MTNTETYKRGTLSLQKLEQSKYILDYVNESILTFQNDLLDESRSQAQHDELKRALLINKIVAEIIFKSIYEVAQMTNDVAKAEAKRFVQCFAKNQNGYYQRYIVACCIDFLQCRGLVE